MKTINLRDYYPFCEKHALEVSDEIAAALEEFER